MEAGDVRKRKSKAVSEVDGTAELKAKEKGAVVVRSQGWGPFTLAFVFAIVALFTILLFLPCPIKPIAYRLPTPPDWEDELEPNEKLVNVERLYENQLQGPESIVVNGGVIYTGTADGKIIRIQNDEVTTLAMLGKQEDCGTFQGEPTCGRPLGMRLNRFGNLLVADAYLGIYTINTGNGKYDLILSTKEPMAGRKAKFINDIEEADDGMLYFTDSSTRWDRRHNRYNILEGDKSGRLLSYNQQSLEVKELASGLAFANGMALSYDQSYILVCETTMARITRYYLTGPKEGTTDVFADNLPGWPDNIRRSGRGTYWVGFAGIRRAEKFSLLDFTAPYPRMRSLIAKLVSQETMMTLIPQYGLLVELNADGRILRSLHDPTGKSVPSVSEVEESDGDLILGSYYLPYLTRLSLSQK